MSAVYLDDLHGDRIYQRTVGPLWRQAKGGELRHITVVRYDDHLLLCISRWEGGNFADPEERGMDTTVQFYTRQDAAQAVEDAVRIAAEAV